MNVMPSISDLAGPDTIVLLHGAFQDGESTWKRVAPELESAGHKVIVVNLPGRDSDGVDPRSLTTQIYRDAVLKAMSSDGQSLIDLAMTDKDSYLAKPGNLEFAPDFSVASIKDDQKGDIFANDATPTDRDSIVSSLIPESAAPQQMRVTLTAENFGRVPKYYIQTTQDHCVSPFLQAQMIADVELVKLKKIDAGHAAYITQPKAVVEAILDAIRS